MFKPRDIIELIADNVKKTRNPFGVPNLLMNRWWKRMDLPAAGDAMLFTGLMYQSVPYIEMTSRHLERYEDSPVADYVRYGRYMPKFLVGLGLALLSSRRAKKKSSDMLHNIAQVLTRSKVDFFYKPELDHYSGVLLYDLGDIDGFISHARFVADRLREKGVNKLITVDPHTTYALKILYPKHLGESFEVKAYFELINFRGENGKKKVTLHDPCMYGRYLEMSDVPTRVLENLGIECVAIRNSGKFTNCCGGPVESLSPKLSREVLHRRVEELQATGAPVVAMCPICMTHLKKGGVEVEDLSTLIARCA
jgi:Fe-S oxidoreductase